MIAERDYLGAELGKSGAHVLYISLALLSFGLIINFSASVDVAEDNFLNPFHYLFRHLAQIIMGVTVAGGAFLIPMDTWRKLSLKLLLLSWLLLSLVLLIGKEVNGSTRWLSLGIINFQPAELSKIFLVLYLADFSVRYKKDLLVSWWGFIRPLIMLSVTGFLLLSQPDLGTLIVLSACCLGMLFLVGVPLGRFIAILFVVVTSLAMFVWFVPYRMKRVLAFLEPFEHAYDIGYQLVMSLIAIGRGGIEGVSLGNSLMKSHFLPEAHTDFIFAIVAEEFGLAGSCALIAAFSFLVYSTLSIGRQSELKGDFFQAFTVYGIGLMFATQSLINISVAMGLLPTKGLTLPFISYGGSSLIVCCLAISICLRAAYEAKH